MVKIISFTICPFVQRVTGLLEAKKISYDIEFIDLSAKPQWFLDISPNAQVPLLIADNKKVLFESEAIIEYLDEIYPPLVSGLSAEDKAIQRAWGYLASKNYLVQCSAQRSPDASILKERSQKLSKTFDKIENQLGNTVFFCGDEVGNVDIAWLPLLHRADIIHQKSGYDFIGRYPQLKRWQKQLMNTGLAEKSVATDFEDAFLAFYMSDKTFLGRKACLN